MVVMVFFWNLKAELLVEVEAPLVVKELSVEMVADLWVVIDVMLILSEVVAMGEEM